MAKLQDYDTSNRFTAKVLKNIRITPADSEEDVRELVLSIESKSLCFSAGQSIAVIVPGPHTFGNPDHFRLYTVANNAEAANGKNPEINICVKRCSYIDSYSGERYKGVASNYLCNLQPGETVTLAGPYGMPFELPDDDTSDILMIGMGTGIAPFRAFVKRIYQDYGAWKGKVRLFYGARSGLEMLYMNDEMDDFTHYCDKEAFKAFKAVSPRPHWDDPIALDYALEERAEEIWNMVLDPKTHVYIAGLEPIRKLLDDAFSKMAGSKEKWQRRKAELIAGKRWTELIY
ncbi:MAG: FAD-binding oxidoreductase [bacterium]